MSVSYAEFQATAAYYQAIPGAALAVRFTCEQDTSVTLAGTVSMGVDATVEQIEIEEGGNEGVTEIATGRINLRASGSAVLTSFRIDQGLLATRTESAAPFLTTRNSWTVEVYDGPRFPAAIDATPDLRIRYAVTGLKLARTSFNHQGRGEVQMQFDGPFQYLYSGAEWAALASG